MYIKYFKRIFDIILSMLALILLIIPMFIIYVAIKIDEPGPAFFKQKRFGRNKTYFWLYKFRSMKVHTPDVPTHLLANPEQYISRIGKFIRKTSIDELPQLWNILKGDMSIIGPRPALWNQEDLITEREKQGANSIRPGLTGYAQINGRDELEINQKATLDGKYATILNSGGFKGLLMDLHCLFKTFAYVFKSKGVLEGAKSESIKNIKEKEHIK